MLVPCALCLIVWTTLPAVSLKKDKISIACGAGAPKADNTHTGKGLREESRERLFFFLPFSSSSSSNQLPPSLLLTYSYSSSRL